MPTIATVGGTIKNYSLTVVYEPQSNGAYFLGDLTKFIHVSPQQFKSVKVQGSGPCGLTVTLKGKSGDSLTHVCVDSQGIVHVTTTTVSNSGVAEVKV
mmetsp:Transcript_73923/g.146981  ORF Transcript_73923/g.146981 Transcript_73923/m.146981 type:complete len:98 (+) Transcript_73923:35-328(+)